MRDFHCEARQTDKGGHIGDILRFFVPAESLADAHNKAKAEAYTVFKDKDIVVEISEYHKAASGANDG